MKPGYFPAILATLLLSYVLFHFYLAAWTIRNFALTAAAALWVKLLFFVLAVSFPFAMYAQHRWDGRAADIFYYFSSIWLGILLIWTTAAFLGNIIVWLFKLSGFSKAHFGEMAVLAVVFLLCSWGLYEGARFPGVREITVGLPGLQRELDGFLIVQISDIHLSSKSKVKQLRKILNKVSEINPDLVVFNGDLVDPGFQCTDELKEMIKSVKSKHGVIGVLGNHEYYFGQAKAAKCYAECGIRLLRNEIIELDGGLQVAGVDDILTAVMTDSEIESLLKKLKPGIPSVYLSHQPLKFDLAVKHGAGLMLSGHTHKGQIFPFNFFVKIFYRNFNGLYEEGKSSLYVTSGAGTWGPPMRLFAPSELPVFRLTRKS